MVGARGAFVCASSSIRGQTLTFNFSELVAKFRWQLRDGLCLSGWAMADLPARDADGRKDFGHGVR